MAQSARVKKRGQINVVIKSDTYQEQGLSMHETKPPSFSRHEHYHHIMDDFSRFVGMESMKAFIHELYAWIYLNKIREKKGFKTEQQSLHMVFKGNPGTGKTSVARLIARMLKEMNVLDKGHLLEVERADLVGEYIGHTAQKTRELVEKAMGGILFVDEAYSLARGGEKDFGKEAIDTLVKGMEDKKDQFVLILAGYPVEMDGFLRLNPGLPSRFPMIVSFPDYTTDQLLQMLCRMAEERDYTIVKEALPHIRELLDVAKEYERGHFSNGRFMRNLLEKAVRTQAVRLLSREDYSSRALMMLTQSDFSDAFKKILLDDEKKEGDLRSTSI